jgi:hypothetical protein
LGSRLMKLFYLVLFLACGSAILLAGNAEAGISVTNSSFRALAYDAIDPGVNTDFNGTAVPTSTTVDAVDGDTYSKNKIDWSLSGTQTIFSFDVDHKRNGSDIATASSRSNYLDFTANSNEPYVLSGYYNVTDVGPSGFAGLYGGLTDLTSDADVFFSNQVSYNTANVHYVLGGTGGETNSAFGSLTGNLIAGHNYEFAFESAIQVVTGPNLGASALGNITLTIGFVPEPSTLVLCLAAIFAAHFGRNETRQRSPKIEYPRSK